MSRILSIDYGSKRVGLAVTDPTLTIAMGLTTVHKNDVISYLKNYLTKEKVECIVIGEPKTMNNEPSATEQLIQPFIKELEQTFPNIIIERMDERFTSKIAFQAMIDGGLKKKQRQNKALIDEISATIILQSYLEKKK